MPTKVVRCLIWDCPRESRIVVVASANVSRSAEEANVELGLRLDEPLLSCAIGDQTRTLEPHVNEQVASG